MKLKNYFIALCVALTSAAFIACDDNDDDHIQPSKVVETAFNQLYPEAQFVTWEREYGKIKAEFLNNGAEADAWFEADGTWIRTETTVPRSALPQPVLDFVASNYAGYHIDDAEWVETPNGEYYELDLEKGDKLEFNLHILPDGTPLN